LVKTDIFDHKRYKACPPTTSFTHMHARKIKTRQAKTRSEAPKKKHAEEGVQQSKKEERKVNQTKTLCHDSLAVKERVKYEVRTERHSWCLEAPHFLSHL